MGCCGHARVQVLDEIHRQSVALSRSATVSRASLPAPSPIVDGFPTRIHLSKPATACAEASQYVDDFVLLCFVLSSAG